jgi:hypothetical protein
MSMAIIPNVKSGLMADDGTVLHFFLLIYFSASEL